MHVLVTCLWAQQQQQSNDILFIPSQAERKIKNLQCMSTETIFKSYMNSFVASQDPENLLLAKFTALFDLQHSSDANNDY